MFRKPELEQTSSKEILGKINLENGDPSTNDIVTVILDCDGTLTPTPGSKLVFSDMYTRLQADPQMHYSQSSLKAEDELKKDFDDEKETYKYDDEANRGQRRIIKEAEVFIKEMLQMRVRLVIVTLNQLAYVKFLLHYENIDTSNIYFFALIPEMDKGKKLADREHALVEGEKKNSVNFFCNSTSASRGYWIFDDDPSKGEEMKEALESFKFSHGIHIETPKLMSNLEFDWAAASGKIKKFFLELSVLSVKRELKYVSPMDLLTPTDSTKIIESCPQFVDTNYTKTSELFIFLINVAKLKKNSSNSQETFPNKIDKLFDNAGLLYKFSELINRSDIIKNAIGTAPWIIILGETYNHSYDKADEEKMLNEIRELSEDEINMLAKYAQEILDLKATVMYRDPNILDMLHVKLIGYNILLQEEMKQQAIQHSNSLFMSNQNAQQLTLLPPPKNETVKEQNETGREKKRKR